MMSEIEVSQRAAFGTMEGDWRKRPCAVARIRKSVNLGSGVRVKRTNTRAAVSSPSENFYSLWRSVTDYKVGNAS
jgi:hypothetical protein